MRIEFEIQTEYFTFSRLKNTTLVNVWRPTKEGKELVLAKQWKEPSVVKERETKK